jgi:hypothetical protein
VEKTTEFLGFNFTGGWVAWPPNALRHFGSLQMARYFVFISKWRATVEDDLRLPGLVVLKSDVFPWRQVFANLAVGSKYLSEAYIVVRRFGVSFSWQMRREAFGSE